MPISSENRGLEIYHNSFLILKISYVKGFRFVI